MIIPAITLWQPWACAVQLGFKPWETRGRPPPKRLIGQRIAIHAAARKQRHGDLTDEQYAAFDDEFGFCGWFHSLPLGVVTCTAILSEVRLAEEVEPDHFGDYGYGRWAWKLDDVFPINPHIKARGQQQYGWPWEVPEGVKIAP